MDQQAPATSSQLLAPNKAEEVLKKPLEEITYPRQRSSDPAIKLATKIGGALALITQGAPTPSQILAADLLRECESLLSKVKGARS